MQPLAVCETKINFAQGEIARSATLLKFPLRGIFRVSICNGDYFQESFSFGRTIAPHNGEKY